MVSPKKDGSGTTLKLVAKPFGVVAETFPRPGQLLPASLKSVVNVSGYNSGNLGGFRAFHEKRRIRVEIGEVEFPGGGNARKLTLLFDDDGASPWVKPIGYAGNGQMAVFLPHWSTLLIMAALWSTWLLCHWKREQKKRNP